MKKEVQAIESLQWIVVLFTCTHLLHTQVLAFGASKAQLGYFELSLPLEDEPPRRPITTDLQLCKGAVLALDFHPMKR